MMMAMKCRQGRPDDSCFICAALLLTCISIFQCVLHKWHVLVMSQFILIMRTYFATFTRIIDREHHLILIIY